MPVDRTELTPPATLSSAAFHILVAGDAPYPTHAPHRLEGWPQVCAMDEQQLAALWKKHRTAITAEASRHGFTAWAELEFGRGKDSASSQEQRHQWSQRFHAKWGY